MVRRELPSGEGPPDRLSVGCHDVGHGLRRYLETIGPRHFTGLRRDEMPPLMERLEMTDEDMVAYLGDQPTLNVRVIRNVGMSRCKR